MTIDNKKPATDIAQVEHENDANSKRVVMFGKTTGGTYIEVALLTSGALA